MNIDTNEYITSNFKWSEALLLRSVDVCVFPDNDIIYRNIIKTARVLEHIRLILNCPLVVTSWYRPSFYNKHIGGSEKSYHVKGLACDFVPKIVSVHRAKLILREYLEDLNIRMENNGSGGWIHIDLRTVKHKRYFKP